MNHIYSWVSCGATIHLQRFLSLCAELVKLGKKYMYERRQNSKIQRRTRFSFSSVTIQTLQATHDAKNSFEWFKWFFFRNVFLIIFNNKSCDQSFINFVKISFHHHSQQPSKLYSSFVIFGFCDTIYSLHTHTHTPMIITFRHNFGAIKD